MGVGHACVHHVLLMRQSRAVDLLGSLLFHLEHSCLKSLEAGTDVLWGLDVHIQVIRNLVSIIIY